MKNTVLRCFNNSDLTLFEGWLRQPHVAAWYGEPDDWLDELQKRHTEFSFIRHFIVESEGRAIGFCQFYEYKLGGEQWHGDTDLEGTYSIDYLIGEPEYLGKGYGKATVEALLAEINKLKTARRIIVKPEPKNTASCRTLLSCGFVYNSTNEIYALNIL